MAYPLGTPFSGSSPATPYSGTFIPEIWSSKLIEKFYDATVLAAISNTDYEGEIKNFGDKVKMRQRPTITIRDYAANMDLVIDRPSAPILELNIDKGKYFNLHLDDVLKMQMDVDLMNQWSSDASEQMKIVIDAQIMLTMVATAAARNRNNGAGRISQNITLGIPGTPVVVTRTNAIDYIVLLGQALDEQNIPEQGRWLVIPAWLSALIKRSDLRDASLSGDGTSMLRNGRLGVIDRFTLYSSNLLPNSVTDGVAGNDADAATYIFAGNKNALTFASQMTEMEVLRSERTFGNLMRGLQVFGSGIIDPTSFAQLYAKPDPAAGSPI